MHEPRELPIVLVAGNNRIRGGQHIRYPKGTPLANLYLRMMDMLNFSSESFGDSTGRLELIT
jgi:hypothetical protein